MSLVRARTWTARSGGECTDHDASAPPLFPAYFIEKFHITLFKTGQNSISNRAFQKNIRYVSLLLFLNRYSLLFAVFISEYRSCNQEKMFLLMQRKFLNLVTVGVVKCYHKIRKTQYNFKWFWDQKRIISELRSPDKNSDSLRSRYSHMNEIACPSVHLCCQPN